MHPHPSKKQINKRDCKERRINTKKLDKESPAFLQASNRALEKDRKIAALAREMLRISHEQELTISDIKAAYNRCESFVLSRIVPADEKGEINQYL